MKKQTIAATVSTTILLILLSINSYGQAAANAAILAHKIDTSITNKSAAKSVTHQAEGGRMKDILNWALGNVDTGGSSNSLNQVLSNGNTSRASGIFLGKTVGGLVYSTIKINNDTALGGEVGVYSTNTSWVRIFQSGFTPAFQVHLPTENTYIATDGAVAGVGGGVTTYHISGNGAAPTSVLYGGSGNAGASATVSGSDLAGVITFTTGTTPVINDTILKITFNHAYIAAPIYANISGANDEAAGAIAMGQAMYVPQTKMFTDKCFVMNKTAALDALSVYQIYYHFIGYHQ